MVGASAVKDGAARDCPQMRRPKTFNFLIGRLVRLIGFGALMVDLLVAIRVRVQ